MADLTDRQYAKIGATITFLSIAGGVVALLLDQVILALLLVIPMGFGVTYAKVKMDRFAI